MFKVSVITTLYNYQRYIGGCIASFFNQDFKDSEMIIVDDNSTDNPYPEIKRYIKRHGDRIKYIKLDKNMGYSHAKNVGIKASNSDILVMLDADDMTTPNGISLRYAEIQKGFDFVHGPVLDFKIKNEMTITSKSKLWKQWTKSKQNAPCYRLIHAQSVMLKKNVHKKIGLYDESLRCKSDREMWARILFNNFKMSYVDDPVSLYRRHSRQMHRSPEKMKINDKLQKRVLSLIEKRKKDLSGLEMLK